MPSNMTRFRWDDPPEKAWAEMYDAYARSIYNGIHELAKVFAPQIEEYLKSEAKWVDRTGNARQSLYAEVEALLTSIAIHMDYGVEYGVFLEFSNQSRFAIIGPALDLFVIQFWNAVKQMLKAP